MLGLLLGEHMEYNLRRALAVSGGDWSILFNSAISISIYVFTAALIAVGLIYSRSSVAHLNDK